MDTIEWEYWQTMRCVADEKLEAARAEKKYWDMKYNQENRIVEAL